VYPCQQGTKKVKRIQIKMPDIVFHTLTFKATSLGVNNSAYVRALIMDQEIISADRHDDKSHLIGLVAKFGNNINQIAHTLNIANLNGNLHDIDYQNLLNILLKLEKNIESTL